MRTARAALVEEDSVVAVGVEECAVDMLRTAAGAAVQEQRRDAVLAADLFDVDPVAVADVEHDGVEGSQSLRFAVG